MTESYNEISIYKHNRTTNDFYIYTNNGIVVKVLVMVHVYKELSVAMGGNKEWYGKHINNLSFYTDHWWRKII